MISTKIVSSAQIRGNEHRILESLRKATSGAAPYGSPFGRAARAANQNPVEFLLACCLETGSRIESNLVPGRIGKRLWDFECGINRGARAERPTSLFDAGWETVRRMADEPA
jgi:hypothetical protein